MLIAGGSAMRRRLLLGHDNGKKNSIEAMIAG